MAVFPLETRLLLKPWFAPQTLAQAQALLKKGSSPLVLAYRQAVAGIWPDGKGWCRLQFAEAPKISQGFRLVEAVCSLCVLRRSNGDLCAHLAALVAQVLVVGPGGTRPAPLAYGGSPWAEVAKFMDQHGVGATISLSPAGWLQVHTEDFWLTAQVAAADLALAQNLFPEQPWPGALAPGGVGLGNMVQEAWRSVQEISRTETEAMLNSRGQQSQGQRLAGGLWSFLGQVFFRSAPAPVWRLERSADGQISLFAESCPGQPYVRLVPNRDLLLDLLQQADLLDLVEIEAKARAYAKIYFSPEQGDILIEPWLELADGRRYEREALTASRYGRYYSIDGLTFFAVHEQEIDFTMEEEATLPLFAISNPPAAGVRRIPALQVPAFMKRFQQAMLSGEHDLDPLLSDFAVVDLPECLEIRDYREEGAWCLLDASYRFGVNRVELAEVQRLHRTGAPHIAGGTSWLQVDNTPLAWLHALPIERQEEHNGKTSVRLTRREMMALTALVPEVVYPAKESVRKTLHQRLAAGVVEELLEVEMPSHLRPYQRQGLAWLHHLYGNGVGGILADDMGLGKTHQALALLNLLASARPGPALVVCPASVLPHWQDKLTNFYPDLTWKVYYGQARNAADLGGAAVILTTYGVLRQDISLLRAMEYHAVILDEIQQLKNKSTVTYQAAAQLEGVAYGLTGTPIENSIADLKAIYDLCLPGLLGSDGSFQKVYLTPIEEYGNEARAEALQRMLSPFMLRRLKDQVLTELPAVIEDVRFCSLSADQVALYRRVIDDEGQPLLSSLNSDPVIPYMKFLAVIQELKQICNHPCQLLKSTNYQNYSSGKWDLFVEILSECLDAGLKVVVFSQYTKMLDIVEAYLKEQGIRQAGIRGAMTPGARQKMIRRFNDDPAVKVFSASLLAGGTGIDLTAAQVVIHYDRWWNAAREEQATARVHRYGQQQVVQVFKFITQGTMEEKIHRLINRKKELAADIIQVDDDSFVKRLSRQDLAELLQWG